MSGWLERLRPGHGVSKSPPPLPVVKPTHAPVPAMPRLQASPRKDGQIPNASLVYGIGAAVLVALALYFLVTGLWLSGLILLFPAGCLFGFALHFLRYKE